MDIAAKDWTIVTIILRLFDSGETIKWDNASSQCYQCYYYSRLCSKIGEFNSFYLISSLLWKFQVLTPFLDFLKCELDINVIYYIFWPKNSWRHKWKATRKNEEKCSMVIQIWYCWVNNCLGFRSKMIGLQFKNWNLRMCLDF